jgi:predicted nucleic acid-binding protein
MTATLRAGVAVLSSQSLREYYNVMSRRVGSGASLKALRTEIVAMRPLVPPELLEDRVADAWAVQDRYKVNFWDALLIAAARTAGCTVFLSEDLQAGQSFDGVRVINPFVDTPAAIGL